MDNCTTGEPRPATEKKPFIIVGNVAEQPFYEAQIEPE
jgi:hypothetical protein